jgi:hypothetical protein
MSHEKKKAGPTEVSQTYIARIARPHDGILHVQTQVAFLWEDRICRHPGESREASGNIVVAQDWTAGPFRGTAPLELPTCLCRRQNTREVEIRAGRANQFNYSPFEVSNRHLLEWHLARRDRDNVRMV